MSHSGRLATAPVPSPRCSPAVISGALPSASSTRRAAGSRGTVAGKHRLGRRRAQPHGAQRRHAADEAVHHARARLPAHRPERRRTARQYQSRPAWPARPAGRRRRAGCAAMPRRMASILRASPSSERPAPRPVISFHRAGPVAPLATALEVVVLPMPISPVASSCTPAAFCSCTSRMPAADGLHSLGAGHGRDPA